MLSARINLEVRKALYINIVASHLFLLWMPGILLVHRTNSKFNKYSIIFHVNVKNYLK